MQTIKTLRAGLFAATAFTIVMASPVCAAGERHFAIPAQPLDSALRSFGMQSDQQLMFSKGAIHGLRSREINGAYSTEEALRRLVQGSGLKLSRTKHGVIILGLAQPAQARFMPAAATAPAVPAAVVDAAPALPDAVEDIVVTAQGRAQRLQDVPISASVTTGATLARVNLRNLEEVTVRLPNVRISQAPVSDFINIRGVGSSLNLGFEQSVGTFVDGIYRGRSRATRASLFDIDRIEILKGPQTTFFGNNTIAGALNIITRKPGSRVETNASAFYAPGSGEYAVEAGASVPLTDTMALRLSGRMSGMDGYIRNTNLDNRGPDLDDRIGRVSLRWDPSEIVEMNGRVDVVRMRDKGIFNSELMDCPPDPILGGAAGPCARYLAANGGVVDDSLDWRSAANPSLSNYDMVEALWNMKITLGEHSVTFTTGFFDHESDVVNDTAPIPGNQGGSVVGTKNTLAVSINEKFRQFSQEVRFQSRVDMPVSYILGAYYSHGRLKTDVYQGVYFAPFGAGSGGEYNASTPVVGHLANREISDVMSVFGAATVNASERARINLGVRYTTVSKDAARLAQIGTSGLLFPTPASFVAGNATTQAALLPVIGYAVGDYDKPSRSDGKLMPAANIQYDVTPDVMGYLSYAKGFKAGGYAFLQAKTSFGPETVDAYELGMKSAFFDRRLIFNVAAFYSKYKDLQESTTFNLASGSATQFVTNVAESTSKGIEIGALLRTTDRLTITADLAYLDARYDDYPGAPCTELQKVGRPGCVQNLSGKRRAFAPEWSGNVGLSYALPVGDSYKATFDGNVYFSSKFFQQPVADPYVQQNGYAKLDARLAFGPTEGPWELAIIGKNLTNKMTASYRQTIVAAGTFQALADPRRSIGLQLSYRH